jgi:ATP/maltotriose-dependent transcriptional regulator MalT
MRITLVIAPAGYGKSVAINQYLASVDVPHIKFSLHVQHASLIGFVRGLADAFAEVSPDARAAFSGAFEKHRASKSSPAHLAAWLNSHVRFFSGLVAVDDLHVADDNKQVSEFLISLIDLTADRVRWLIGSRSTAHLPIGTWLAYGHSDLQIDQNDLQFTVDEARTAAKASSVAMNDGELQGLLNATEGWPTALGFALLASTRSLSLDSIAAGTRELTYRYLAEQVYESLDVDQRDFLHLISHFDEIDLDVLAHAHVSHARQLIEDLRSRVAFITQESPGLYRCHDLFREFLRDRLQLLGTEEYTRTARRAARALEQSGHLASALRLYADVTASKDVTRMLHSFGSTLVDQGYADAVQRAIDALPADTRNDDPVVIGIRAQIEAHAGHFDRADGLFQRGVQRSSDSIARCRLVLRLALIRINQMRDVTDILAPFIDSDLPAPLQLEVMSLLSVAFATTGATAQSLDAIRAAEVLLSQVTEEPVIARALHRVGVAMSYANMPVESSMNATLRAAELAGRQSMFSLVARAYVAAGHIIDRNHDDVTRRVWFAQQALIAATKAGDPFDTQTALLQMLDIESRRGEPERVHEIETQLNALVTSDAGRPIYAFPARATILASEGHFTEACRLMAMAVKSDRFYDFDRALNLATYALLLAVGGRLKEATEAVALALAQADAISSRGLSVVRAMHFAWLLCAAAEALNGRHTKSLQLLRKAAPADEAPIVTMRTAIEAFCRALDDAAMRVDANQAIASLDQLGYGGYAHLLRAVLDHWLDVASAARAGLTETQIEILEALSLGETPKEIAQRTARSLYTVRAHIQNVIKSFGCSGHVEALAIARQRHLIL